MRVKQAKDMARRWVLEEATNTHGFVGAFYHGSTNWLPDDAALPATSDVDVMVVLADPNPPVKLGKFLYRDVMLEVSYLPSDQLHSLAQVRQTHVVEHDYIDTGVERCPHLIERLAFYFDLHPRRRQRPRPLHSLGDVTIDRRQMIVLDQHRR